MPTLSEQVLTEPNRQALIEEVAALIEAHVAALKGLKGIGLRTGLGMLKAARHNAVPEAVSRLLPGAMEALEPDYQAFLSRYADLKTAGKPAPRNFGEYLAGQPAATAEALMGVVDARVSSSRNTTLASVYPKLRGSIASEIEPAIPKLAGAVAKYLRA